METAMIEKTEIDEFRQDGAIDITEARRKAAEIKDIETYGGAAKLLIACKDRIKRIQERLKDPKKKAREAWQGWIDLEIEKREATGSPTAT